LEYYAEYGFLQGSSSDPIYQAVLKIHNAGFELAHELAKCGHARANYRDPNYKKGDTECDSSKCEFCVAIAQQRAEAELAEHVFWCPKCTSWAVGCERGAALAKEAQE
jgi:hypothetical protein